MSSLKQKGSPRGSPREGQKIIRKAQEGAQKGLQQQDPKEVEVPSRIHMTLNHRVSVSSIVATCRFHFSPDMCSYYYNPLPSEIWEKPFTTRRTPILSGSPTFNADWDTKWQVTLTTNHWIGVHRWVSLYLTRADMYNPASPVFQCEFRIVDDDGNVLKSFRNHFGFAMPSGSTSGITRFLLFSEFERMITKDSYVNVEVHLDLMCSFQLPEINNDDISDNDEISEIQEVNEQDQAKPPLELTPEVIITTDDNMEG